MVDEPTQPFPESEGLGDEPSLPPYIGPFRVLERIGSGGMGVVYLAEREEPKQRVALKVIRADKLDRLYRARFRLEQQALARMDHPNIARLYDAGEEAGLAWFAMEYVPGQPLSDYCREHKLTLEQRLRVFAQICDGVQHAHMKGLLHRDLKPGNILVREIDGAAVAKIIDFGLAQPIDATQQRATLHEGLRQIVGTFAYMSPEQASRTEGDLDTRTDVYSLGVVLYELLTGQLPIDLDVLRRSEIQLLVQLLREREPPKPSTRLSSLGAELSSTAAERRVSPQRLRSLIRGELDWVTMKALARDRQQRYATVRELGQDVERYLRKEPVLAGPPGTLYVLRKWVQRHAAGVAVAGSAAIALTTVVYLMTRVRESEVRRQLLAASQHAVYLVERGRHELWPATEAMIEPMQEWLLAVAHVRSFASDLVDLERQLLTESGSLARSQLAQVHASQAALASLVQLELRVRGRLARAVDAMRTTAREHDEAWSGVRQHVADDPALRAMFSAPVVGLIPLGPNPKSHLLEFYLPSSGTLETLPHADAEGNFAVDAGTGLILVLLPGGRFVAPGAGAGDPSARCETGPFLIAKYEMTQAQWARLVSENVVKPDELAHHLAGNTPPLQRLRGEVPQPVAREDALTWQATVWGHPVQQVSWEDAQRFLPRWQLRLPTVVEWWWAAGGAGPGGYELAWASVDLGEYANYRDDFRASRGPSATGRPTRTWDGFFNTCPVDAMPANPAGLHCIFGNVAELCQDGYLGSGGDGEMPLRLCPSASETRRAMAMGGGFLDPIEAPGRHRGRIGQVPASWVIGHQLPITNISDSVGVRPVFALPRSKAP